MDSKELFKLAFSSLRANKLRSALTTLGIIIGVFSVILLVSLGTGLQKYITDQVSGLGSNLIFVVPGTFGSQRGSGNAANKLLLSDVKNIESQLKSFALVSPLISKSSTVKVGSKSNKGTTVYGTGPSFPKIIKIEIQSGTFFTTAQDRGGSKVAVIGWTVADKLFPNTNPLGKKIVLSGTRFTVIGIAKKRGSVFGVDQDNLVVIPVTVARKVFSVDRPSAIYLAANKPEYVSLVKKRVNDVLLKRLEEDDFTVQTQEQTLSTVTSITGVLTAALGGIAAISLLVGGIGVMNIMLVSVTERTKEIGLRKALGAKRVNILSQFLLEAIILSLFGGMIGIVLGWGVSLIVSKFFVAEVTLWSVLLSFGFSVAVGVIFGIAPAIRASRLSPIEALRYE
jgi:putative ABC transport system permease protein